MTAKVGVFRPINAEKNQNFYTRAMGHLLGRKVTTPKKNEIEVPDPTENKSGPKFKEALISKTIELMASPQSFIGGGSYGSVYKVPYLGKTYAVKVIDSPRQIVRISKRTGNIAHHVYSHPNLIKVHFVHTNTTATRAFVIMDFINGKGIRGVHGSASSLKLDLSRGAPLTPQDNMELDRRLGHVRILISDVTNALLHLKKHHLMHRDVKESNVMQVMHLDGSLQYKLFDYDFIRDPRTSSGVPKSERKGCADRSMTPLGTYQYSAPEVLDVDTLRKSDYTYSADVWSLGALIYSVTVDTLSEAKSVGIMGLRQRSNFSFPTSYPESLKDLVLWCTMDHPKSRPSLKEVLSHPFIINS